MKIIISPDSFKGSCSALGIAKNIQEAIYSLDSSVDFVTILVASDDRNPMIATTYGTGELMH